MILTAKATGTSIAIEPCIFAILEEMKARRLTGPYIPRSIADVTGSRCWRH